MKPFIAFSDGFEIIPVGNILDTRDEALITDSSFELDLLLRLKRILNPQNPKVEIHGNPPGMIISKSARVPSPINRISPPSFSMICFAL